MAVSYTHLDVYKRQELLAIIEKNSRIDLKELAVILGVEEIDVVNELAALEAEGIICGYHTPVSYTHLDVYKRQAKNSPRRYILCYS